MSVELTIETVEETIVLELQDHVPAVLTIDNIPDLRDELDSRVDKVEGYSLVADDEIDKLSTVERYAQKNTISSVAGKQGDVLLDKHDVGLSAVDNTADADKPVSTAVAAALADKVDKEAGMGLSELSFTTADKFSLDQSEQDRHTHSNKTVIDGLSDDSGVLQYKGLPISDQAALDAKVDKVAGYSLVDDTEIAKLATVQENATANRADSENADKVHGHDIDDIDTLAAKLELINQWLQVPADKKYFDFVGNRYSADGVPATLASLGSTFTRLSSATQWKDGVLADVAANVMRIDKAKGLLIEPQRTNHLTSLDSKSPRYGSNQDVTFPLTRTTDPDGFYRYSPTSPADKLSMYGIGVFYGLSTPSVQSMYISGSSLGIEISVHESVASYKPITTSLSAFTVSPTYGTNRLPLVISNPTTSVSGKYITLKYAQWEAGSEVTSWIRSGATATTRSKDTLVVPFTTGQTVTADKDAGVTMTITGTNAVFEGHGYIRNVRVN